MKKQLGKKKLQLARETLKSLESGELAQAAGATHWSGEASCSCYCSDTCNCPVYV